MKIGMKISYFLPDSDPRVALPYPKIREIAQMAEAGGLDSIWLSDHLLYRFDPDITEGPWECWTLLTALAELTTRVEVGTIVLCSPFRNPALVAKMAHTIDEISGGRLILGIGAGWHQPEFDAFGYPFDRRVDRFEEALQIIQPLLKGKSVSFVGTHHQARDCLITPTGPRPDSIPLLIAAFGPRMLRLTAQYADMWNTAWLGEAKELNEPRTALHSACIEAERDPSTLDVTAGVSVAFPDLGNTRPFAKKPLIGSIDYLARAFQQYADAGTTHLIIQYSPSNLQALEHLIAAVSQYRENRQVAEHMK